MDKNTAGFKYFPLDFLTSLVLALHALETDQN